MSRRILVVGESGQSSDDYDAKAVATLISGLRPDWTVHPRKKPPLLAKTGDRRKLAASAERLASLWRQEGAVRRVDCLYNHEDTDDVEPSHVPLAARIESSLRSAGCPGHAVACAWELEAWFLMWPDAIEATRRAWVVPRRLRGRNVGQITDPKRELETRLAVGKPPQLRYQEKHAPEVAAQIASRLSQRTGTSESYERFLRTLDECQAR
ncbi:MAG: hypothetical protein MSC31_14705 [Solirubrobacteraceae bacterium MAG38_C4-C5]|nr:hypothetical protein [Candidatus Siliceabacter maunaloa]